MLREVTLEEISDGKLYRLNDMVKAGCDDCRDCSACCCGMGSSIILDPYDMYRLVCGLGLPAARVLEEYLELNVVDGIVQPNLKIAGEREQCGFLNEEGRCSIHPYRPGICRLFPLGRYYEEDGSFQYFLQIHECRKENRTKVKVRRWIDTPDAGQYEQFITNWHRLLKRLQENMTKDNARTISMLVLQHFYLTPYGGEEENKGKETVAMDEFYRGFYDRLNQVLQWIEERS